MGLGQGRSKQRGGLSSTVRVVASLWGLNFVESLLFDHFICTYGVRLQIYYAAISVLFFPIRSYQESTPLYTTSM